MRFESHSLSHRDLPPLATTEAKLTAELKAIPAGYEGQVRPRSGLAKNYGVTVANAPGTVDSDYRGEVQVLLVNLGREAYIVRPRDRIAQLVIAPVTRVCVKTWQPPCRARSASA